MIDEIRTSCSRQLTPQFLQDVSRLIIDLYRSSESERLVSLLRSLEGSSTSPNDRQPKSAFFKLIKLYHPDSMASHRATLSSLNSRNTESTRTFYDSFFRAKSLLGSPVPKRSRDLNHAEEYSFDSDDYGSDFYDGQSVSEQETEGGIISILNSVFLGSSTPQSLEPIDLAQLTELINLSNCGITDMDGIQYCKNITGLDVSSNRITNVYDLAMLQHLEILDLRNNQIDSIDPLRGLENLRELYLDDNEIEDISCLSSCDRLEVLSVTNNPITNIGPIRELQERNVIVVYY